MKENNKQEEKVERINDRIAELEKCLEEFSEIDIPEFEQYKDMPIIKSACERYFERIMEEIISITLLIIRLKKFTIPESEEHAFKILAKNNIIDNNFAERLKDAKDMRNRIVHNYLDINDSIVYHALTEEIIEDARKFLNIVKDINN